MEKNPNGYIPKENKSVEDNPEEDTGFDKPDKYSTKEVSPEENSLE